MPRFHVLGTYELDRHGKRTLLFGDVLDGTVRKDMLIVIPLNDSLNAVCEIEGIEMLNDKVRKQGYVGLLIRGEEEPGDYDGLLASLPLKDKVLEVQEVPEEEDGVPR